MATIGPTFRDALAYAARLHEGQWRKRSGDDLPWIPYLSHLLGVASLVLEVDGDEDEAVAALLHDAVEDHPRGGDTEREIGERFGPRVLEIVRHCTKPEIDEDGPPDVVRARRQRQARDYIDGFRPAGPSVKLVAAADKLHNARAIVSDLREHGPRVWDRFNKTRDETLGYYVELVEALRGGDGRSRRLVDELGRTVEEMHRLAGQRPSVSPGGSA
jgi:(p)ppGpp synthase/HD superfamily hydrolase